MTDILTRLRAAIGADHVLTGADTAKWSRDWLGHYAFTPLAVLRPGSTAEVSAILAIANDARVPVVPVSGNTGLAGGTNADGVLMLSVDRLTRIRDLSPGGRTVTAEAGVILDRLHAAAAEHDLIFPLTFGARGSAMVGGFLSTNAGGSNVLRYGNARDLCLGIEVVLADGRVMDLMSALHKDNSGLNLRHLMIGAEGTLGIVTAAVLKLRQRPRAYATAMVAMPTLEAALGLLHRVQDATGGAVEAFEYMPRSYVAAYRAHRPDLRPPFDAEHDVNILIEVGATAPADAAPLSDGSVPVVSRLEDMLADMMDTGDLLDAVVARTDAQRRAMWAMREAAAELVLRPGRSVAADICLPLDRVAAFLAQALSRVRRVDPGAEEFVVSHLGDGNVHYTIFPDADAPDTPDRADAITEAVEDLVQEMNGSFSAEHGIGVSKLATMRRRKDPVALDAMRAIKAALDPRGILNPGKTIPGR